MGFVRLLRLGKLLGDIFGLWKVKFGIGNG